MLSSSSSAGSDSDSSDSSSNSSRFSSSLSEDSDSSPSRKKRSKKMLDLDLLEVLWPKEDRPDKLQSKSTIKHMSLSKLMKMKEIFDKEQAKRGLGVAVHGKDKPPKSQRFKEQRDNGTTKLHPARFLCMPFSEPKEYWNLVPTGRSQIYRHLPMQHLGVEDTPEATIVKLHDRKVPVDLDMMARDVKDLKQAQLAVANYVTIMRILHPIDMGPATIQLVLIHASFGENLGDNLKNRLLLVKRFFEESARENSGRAVRKEPPMTFEQVQAKWVKIAASIYPNLGLSKFSAQLAAMGSSDGAKNSQQQAGSNSQKQTGSKQQQPPKQAKGKIILLIKYVY